LIVNYLNFEGFIHNKDKMVMRTIEVKEIGLEVGKERQEEVIKKLKESYPDLKILQEGNIIKAKGDLRNYKKRSNIIYILSRGKHGENIQAS